ncbi:hypothetical protein [Neptunicella sp.]|uniref:hypothetical protein n=1 Tax=Neptunicella sp. TaxID=2125986 RepID=UPI003F68D58F
MDNSSLLIWSTLFGGIGIGFFIYGKKQKRPIPLLVGISLFIYPYFMPNVTLLILVGIGLISLPYFIRR